MRDIGRKIARSSVAETMTPEQRLDEIENKLSKLSEKWKEKVTNNDITMSVDHKKKAISAKVLLIWTGEESRIWLLVVGVLPQQGCPKSSQGAIWGRDKILSRPRLIFHLFFYQTCSFVNELI